jgi:hypothetical protein
MGFRMYKHQFSPSARRSQRYPYALRPEFTAMSLEHIAAVVEDIETMVMEIGDVLFEHSDVEVAFDREEKEGKPS